MNEAEYLELTTVRGCFAKKAHGERWAREKRREGYSVQGPFKSPFAYSNDKPWEATAEASFTIESRWS